jgi:riboflavin biosynthesis pyrimidine reductase
VRQIYPVQGPEWALAPKPAAGLRPDTVVQLAALYGNGEAGQATADRPWLRANMVTSIDGAAALDGLSGALSGPADRMVFTVLRSLADVILVGAGTARAEHYRPVAAAGIWTTLRPEGARLPAIAVVTGSLDLDACAGLLAGGPDSEPPIVITTAAAAAERGSALAGRAVLLVAGQQRVDIRQAVTELARLGYRQILTEGGPGLLGQLAEAGLLDELCLTIGPVLAGGPAGRIVTGVPAGAALQLTLAHVLTDDGYLLCRYLRER